MFLKKIKGKSEQEKKQNLILLRQPIINSYINSKSYVVRRKCKKLSIKMAYIFE